ncbi:N-carbamoylsarcosine amidohydrolase [Paraburkholderia nemoris]|uniref:N-carbamoylsarcosine amidohydrolase n=1 Tax=Paraburkholderia nemoris TaxID=2793076 RepID=UPI0038BB0457
MRSDIETYRRQSFGAELAAEPPFGLLIIDFVNGFADPKVFGGGNIADAISNTVPLLKYAREKRWPIAHTRIVFADDDADQNIFTLKVPGMLALKEADASSAVVSALTPREGELVVRKTVPSAFFGTSLAAWLTHRGVKTLLIAGAVTSGCVRASVVDAMQYGFRPFVLADCVGDRALGPHEANLFDMAQKYATVLTRDEALKKLEEV